MNGFHKNAEYFEDIDKTIDKVEQELRHGLELLRDIERPLVGIFGSHITPPGSPEYEHCKALAHQLGVRGYGVVSGGGPGIMQAANQGAMQAGVDSVGLRMSRLKNETVEDHPYTATIDFDYMFVRRFILSVKSSALIFYPGGFGTLNELFEYIVLMQTELTDTVPAILVNREFWGGMLDWVDEQLVARGLLTHADRDLKLIKFADTPEEVIAHITGNH